MTTETFAFPEALAKFEANHRNPIEKGQFAILRLRPSNVANRNKFEDIERATKAITLRATVLESIATKLHALTDSRATFSSGQEINLIIDINAQKNMKNGVHSALSYTSSYATMAYNTFAEKKLTGEAREVWDEYIESRDPILFSAKILPLENPEILAPYVGMFSRNSRVKSVSDFGKVRMGRSWVRREGLKPGEMIEKIEAYHPAWGERLGKNTVFGTGIIRGESDHVTVDDNFSDRIVNVISDEPYYAKYCDPQV